MRLGFIKLFNDASCIGVRLSAQTETVIPSCSSSMCGSIQPLSKTQALQNPTVRQAVSRGFALQGLDPC